MTADVDALVLVGTKAQYIKTAPLLLEFRRVGLRYRLIYTGQHSETFAELEQAFGLPTADDNMVPDNEADSAGGIVQWAIAFCIAAFQRIRKSEWRGARWGVVHGDTASTLLTAVALRIAGVPVVHVEAGLRSPQLLNPFPEEIIRRLVSRIAVMHCAPDVRAIANLSGVGGSLLDTRGNTMLDALRFALEKQAEGRDTGGDGGYAIATMHRSENLASRATMDSLLDAIVAASKALPVWFVLHPVTRRKLAKTGWLERLEREPGIRLTPRSDYVTFVGTMLRSRFLLTDGGSNQEEAALLGLPTLLLRSATERRDGLDGGCVEMSGLDPDVIARFVERHRDGAWRIRALPPERPSAVIAAALLGSQASAARTSASSVDPA